MSWKQDQSDLYRQLSMIAVPHRAEQIAALLTLMPFAQGDAFRVVELASGEGHLSHAILMAFPSASILALDIEATMRAETERRCAAFSDRIQTASFDIQSNDWYPYLDEADVVVSSLCVHHLDGAQKQRLFHTVTERISSRGVLLIADLIAPKRTQSLELFAAIWDQVVHEIAGETRKAAVDLFEAEQWNIFRYPDDFDKPSPLSDQLLWLTEAGFSDVDCFWLNAGHAIYGGYQRNASSDNLPYEIAVQMAHASLFSS